HRRQGPAQRQLEQGLVRRRVYPDPPRDVDDLSPAGDIRDAHVQPYPVRSCVSRVACCVRSGTRNTQHATPARWDDYFLVSPLNVGTSQIGTSATVSQPVPGNSLATWGEKIRLSLSTSRTGPSTTSSPSPSSATRSACAAT